MTPIYLEHDWFRRALPNNIKLGDRTWLYSSYAFSHYASRTSIGLCVGDDTGLYHGTFFDLGPEGEIEIGDFCSLVGVIFAINGRVSIGNYSFIAHEVVIADTYWPLPGNHRQNAHSEIAASARGNAIEIGQNVWIGAKAIIVGKVRIGDGAIIGAGSLVTQDVPAYTLCAGNPLQVVRAIPRDNDMVI
jgi:acetyltransferase-like isoleucine patch superfamily enzyme